MSRKIRNLRKVRDRKNVLTDGLRYYYLAEIGSSGDVYIPNATPNRLLAVDASKKVESVATLSDWIKSADKSIGVTDVAGGTVDLAIPRAHQFYLASL